MKKLLALFAVVGFVASVAGAVPVDIDVAKEQVKVRAYIKQLDTKIVKARKAGDKAKVTKLQAEKRGAIARFDKLKGEQIEVRKLVTPPPAPVAPVPPAAPVVVKPAAPAGLFGWGMNSELAVGYVNTGIGQISGSGLIKGSWVMDDFVGLGQMVGGNSNTIKYKLSLAGVYGGGGMKAIPLFLDGVINFSPDMLGGLDSYLTGGINQVLYGNGKTSGRIGGEIFIGFRADLGLGSKTALELGWSAIRSSNHTSKGFSLNVSQPIVL